MAHLWVSSQGKRSKEETNIDQAWNFSKQLSNALRYLQDVVKKNILEQLPGASSILLEIVITGYTELRIYLINNEQSSVMVAATNQMYNSLAELIKWSDVYLIHGNAALNKDRVEHFVTNLKDAVNNLIQLCVDRYKTKDQLINYQSFFKNKAKVIKVQLNDERNDYFQKKPTLIKPSHRSSLPDLSSANQNLSQKKPNYSNIVNVDSNQLLSDCVPYSHSIDSILSPQFGTFSNNSEISKLPITCLKKDGLNCEKKLSYLNVNSSNVSQDIPPPLPPKKRSFIVNSSIKTSFPSEVFQKKSFNSFNETQASSVNTFLKIQKIHNCYSVDDLIISKKPLSVKFNSFQNESELTRLVKEKNISHSQSIHSQFSKEYSKSKLSSITNSELNAFIAYHDDKIKDATQNLKTLNLKQYESFNSIPTDISFNLRNNSSLEKIEKRPSSFYDNVCETNCEIASSKFNNKNNNQNFSFGNALISSKHSFSYPHQLSNQTSVISCPVSSSQTNVKNKPPPLPPKKKNIMAYMQMMGSYYGPNDLALNFYRHSVHTLHLNPSNVSLILQQLEMDQQNFSQQFPSCNDLKLDEPDLVMSSDSEVAHINSNFDDYKSTLSILPPEKMCLNQSPKLEVNSETLNLQNNLFNSLVPSSESGIGSQSNSIKSELDDLIIEGPLDEIDVKAYLIYKNSSENGPEIRGGRVNALIVKAAEVSKNDFLFQEAFLTTYRTFINPADLVHKLLYRYNNFINYADIRQRAAKNSFALLVRAVDELIIGECNDNLMQTLLEFIYQLVTKGELTLARVLRSKVIEKLEIRRSFSNLEPHFLPSINISSKTWNLHDFKPELISEQMTLLDSELFDKIEIAEVLLWVREQKEDQIPNLNKFTEHFNKISYWVRSRVIELEDAKEREKSMLKLIKIMKNLRKLNNFNSYLAILSALSSGPIRRLDWQKNIIDALEELCSLIDSSSSFRAYRQVLAETQPPCIPYIGLILQDLTFVNIGNSDNLNDTNVVNFSKNWQIFNILNQIKRFRKSHYPFKKNEQVLAYFNNFDNYLSEEAIWQISETLRPRPTSKK